MANTSASPSLISRVVSVNFSRAIWQQDAQTTSIILLAAEQEPYKNSLTPDETRWREKVRKWQDTERQRTSDQRETHTERHRERERHTQRETERETERETQRERQRQRDRERGMWVGHCWY